MPHQLVLTWWVLRFNNVMLSLFRLYLGLKDITRELHYFWSIFAYWANCFAMSICPSTKKKSIMCFLSLLELLCLNRFAHYCCLVYGLLLIVSFKRLSRTSSSYSCIYKRYRIRSICWIFCKNCVAFYKIFLL